jgi:leucyl-tRNA synthetase
LIVEADGGYHETEEQKKYDEERTKILNEIGFTVLRFSNEEIKKNLKQVTQKIKNVIAETTSPLSTRGEGLGVRETNTMPGYAGSSWYFLRYMDPHNDEEFCNKKFSDYWNQVDLYVGGTEHAVGHLLYSRMWTKALYDLKHISFDEPYRKLLNQGMIQGSSRFVYRLSNENVKDFFEKKYENAPSQLFVSYNIYSALEKLPPNKQAVYLEHYITNHPIVESLKQNFGVTFARLHVDVNLVDGVELNVEEYKKSRLEYANVDFVREDGKYICGVEVEKMSKSKFNTVNPDDLVVKYGADTFRMYEMFLGPVEMSKPWDTKGIEGVHRFLKKLWRLFFDEQKGLIVTTDAATNAELKILHKTIKKIEEDTERFSYNTAVSAFMVCVNELMDVKCHKREILQPLIILLTPYAPHISEELWHVLGNQDTILDAPFPKLEEKYLVETAKEYPISINGKLRTQLVMDLNADQKQVEEIVLQNPVVQKWLEGKSPKKIIYVKGKMVNVVI